MDQIKENPPSGGGLSSNNSMGSNSWNNTQEASDYQVAVTYLVTKYGVPKVRVRTVAELVGFGGAK